MSTTTFWNESEWWHGKFTDECYRNEPKYKEMVGNFIANSERRRPECTHDDPTRTDCPRRC